MKSNQNYDKEKMNNKLVSVNITTYNRAHLLPRCLDSVLTQTYENLEIVIVDDCSNDNTEEVAKEYQKKDKRIKYFKHKKNMGNAHARNTALKNCNGYYVAFMDDDDKWIDKDKIKKQVEIFENSDNKKLGIICSSIRIYSDKNTYKDKIIQKPQNLKEHILAMNGIIYSPTVMTKRDIMIEVGGFDMKLPKGIDSDFYRNCIVRYNYDVFFVKDITTAIYECGNDRMTVTNSCEKVKKLYKAHFLTYKKYLFYFILFPKAFFKRLFNMIISIKGLRLCLKH